MRANHQENNYQKLKTEAGLKQLTEYARKGLTMEQIASKYGINRITLWSWAKDDKNIQKALNDGKSMADEFVEQALYDSCFDHKVNEVFIEKDGDGNVVKTTVKTKIIPANTTAQQYWLANRKGDVWKAKQQLDITSNNKPIQINIIDDLKPFIPPEDNVQNHTSKNAIDGPTDKQKE